MDTDEHRFILKEKSFQVIGCAMEAINILGHGLLEKPYENALMVEFALRKIPCKQQPQFKVVYKNTEVGTYIPDIIVYDQIVVDLKTVDNITNHEKGQMLNYLKITGLNIGLIINFKYSKLQWERLAL